MAGEAVQTRDPAVPSVHPDLADFAALADHLPEAAWIAAADGSITWYNRRWYDYTGTTVADMAGWGWQAVHDPNKLPEVLERWRHSIRTGAPFEMVFPLRGADGTFRPFLTRVRPVKDDHGVVTRWIGSNTDITGDVAAQIAETERARAQLANQAKTDFLATMSHEIRTPLNGILGYANLLLDGEDDRAAQRRMIERIRAAGEVLLTIVDDILDFSKIEAGKVEIEPLPFSLAAMVDACISIIGALAAQKGITLVAEIAADLPATVIGDRDRLRQVLLNLLNNAIKFTARGSVSLTVQRTVARDTAGGAEHVYFAVQDTGIGIPDDRLERLFRRFSQVDGSTARMFGGTGLGLAISKSLVEMMDGTIGVESRSGEGSTFWFKVPLPGAAVLDSRSVEPSNPVARTEIAGATLLLVEDVAINQEIGRLMLEGAGHRVDVAADGVAAIAAVQARAYDLILMDIQMPGMDGITATQHIRAMGGAFARMPIIALTANVLPHQVAAFAQAGMNGHLGKPFKPDALDSIVRRWCCPNQEMR